MEYYQTGDVLYIKMDRLPEKTELVTGDLFHKGENHSHRVRGDFAIHQAGDDMFLECKGECDLFHEEHHTIKAKPGIYQKRIVVEYDHVLEESRKVID